MLLMEVYEKALDSIFVNVLGRLIPSNECKLLNESEFDEMWLIKVDTDAYADDSKDLLDYSTYKEEVE